MSTNTSRKVQLTAGRTIGVLKHSSWLLGLLFLPNNSSEAYRLHDPFVNVVLRYEDRALHAGVFLMLAFPRRFHRVKVTISGCT